MRFRNGRILTLFLNRGPMMLSCSMVGMIDAREQRLFPRPGPLPSIRWSGEGVTFAASGGFPAAEDGNDSFVHHNTPTKFKNSVADCGKPRFDLMIAH